MRSKLKNYVTGGVLEKTFRAGETLQAAQIEKRDSQFTYTDGDDVSILALIAIHRCSNQGQTLRKCFLDASIQIIAIAHLRAKM